MSLTIDEIKGLVQVQQMMDSGEIAFVFDAQNQRFAVISEAMAEFGLVQGQTITDQIQLEIMRFNVSHMRAKVEIQKAMESIHG